MLTYSVAASCTLAPDYSEPTPPSKPKLQDLLLYSTISYASLAKGGVEEKVLELGFGGRSWF